MSEMISIQNAALSVRPMEIQEEIQEDLEKNVETEVAKSTGGQLEFTATKSNTPVEQYLPLYINFGGNQAAPVQAGDDEASKTIIWLVAGLAVILLAWGVYSLFKR